MFTSHMYVDICWFSCSCTCLNLITSFNSCHMSTLHVKFKSHQHPSPRPDKYSINSRQVPSVKQCEHQFSFQNSCIHTCHMTFGADVNFTCYPCKLYMSNSDVTHIHLQGQTNTLSAQDKLPTWSNVRNTAHLRIHVFAHVTWHSVWHDNFHMFIYMYDYISQPHQKNHVTPHVTISPLLTCIVAHVFCHVHLHVSASSQHSCHVLCKFYMSHIHVFHNHLQGQTKYSINSRQGPTMKEVQHHLSSHNSCILTCSMTFDVTCEVSYAFLHVSLHAATSPQYSCHNTCHHLTISHMYADMCHVHSHVSTSSQQSCLYTCLTCQYSCHPQSSRRPDKYSINSRQVITMKQCDDHSSSQNSCLSTCHMTFSLTCRVSYVYWDVYLPLLITELMSSNMSNDIQSDMSSAICWDVYLQVSNSPQYSSHITCEVNMSKSHFMSHSSPSPGNCSSSSISQIK